ncbi:hypothetical protein PHMEG_0004549 [Phytophthora megakarya]|uniref:Uncharacterized protein n=1 Tax=Phytophthora megakarya TaxID=4795 RepID=A0A225WVA0_9STRA|nr:hypothetical protein PHMEG_0004549 [Phytophthora megakarya]
MGYLLPVIQVNLNQSPVASLANKTPLEILTGLVASTPLDVCLFPDRSPPLQQVDIANIDCYMQRLRASLHEMHMKVVICKKRRRFYQQTHKKGDICSFTTGDYVLWSRVDASLHDGKRLVRWVGPFQIFVAKLHSFMVVTFSPMTSTKLKFYQDPNLELTEEMVAHVASQGIIQGVEAIREHRFNSTSRQ